jgi:hypothetical protein
MGTYLENYLESKNFIFQLINGIFVSLLTITLQVFSFAQRLL